MKVISVSTRPSPRAFELRLQKVLPLNVFTIAEDLEEKLRDYHEAGRVEPPELGRFAAEIRERLKPS